MKQVNGLELTVLAATVAAVATGCASSGYARYDADHQGAHVASYRADPAYYDTMATDRDHIASASASMGTDARWATGYPSSNVAQVQAGTPSMGASATAEFGAGTGATAQVNTYPPQTYPAQVTTYPSDARVDATVPGVGVSATADMGTSADVNTRYYQNNEYVTTPVSDHHRGEGRVTVSALSFSPETRPAWVNKFPFYNYNLRNVGETFTFAVPDRGIHAAVHADTDLPQFSVNLPPGSVFVESAGGAGEVRTGRVIQHSPNPTR